MADCVRNISCGCVLRLVQDLCFRGLEQESESDWNKRELGRGRGRVLGADRGLSDTSSGLEGTRSELRMLRTVKIVLIAVALFCDVRPTDADAVKRDLAGQQPGLEFLNLGYLGPLSRLPSHPALAHLGLTPRQSTGFVDVLLQNGLLAPHALRLANGHPFGGDFFGGQPVVPMDPYFMLLMANYARFLPYGLGPQGLYGSTGLPKPRPLGVLKYEKS